MNGGFKRPMGKMRPPLPQSFSTDLLFNRVRQSGKVLRFRKRQVIFSTGDSSDSLFFIENGSAKLTLTSLQGKEAVVCVLHAGEFFGESALTVDRLPRSTNAIALTDLRATKIGRETMLQLLHTQPQSCDTFISCLVGLMSELTANMADQLLYGSEQRLARALLSVVRLHENEEFQLLPKMSQQDLANMIGVTRQRVNLLLKRFRELGFIDYAGALRVHNSIKSAARPD